MDMIVWAGAVVSLAGVAGLVWCILYVIRLRRATLDEATMRARMQKAVLVNFAALAVSTLGLMMVVAGIFLS
ncbi:MULTISPECIES: hypothetical protein [Roseinatronobacter]|mgnify:CR=1 FL=1|uniref:Uncharacterized protein n=1 Tax=Roseinatronobacter domitianus TaxID=2940293 RepID=A0ABT0LZZ9_9RHOB|nr:MULTISPECIES: hypothetical protein [Roseibaca]MCL1627923.1 hypothetical protein [Roseibaca domitiana]